MKLKKFMLPILLGGLLLNQSQTSASSEIEPMQKIDGFTMDELIESSDEELKIAAHARYRFEYTQDVDEDQWFQYNLYLTSHLKNGFDFVVAFSDDDVVDSENVDVFNGPRLKWLAFVGEVGHGTQLKLGRQDLMLGYGSGIGSKRRWDGVSAKIELGNSDSTLRIGAFENGNLANGNQDCYVAAYDGEFNDKLGLRASYFHNKDAYKLGTIGAQYKFDSPVIITAEYGRNQETKANGYFAQINYQTADLDEERSWTTWLQYRKSDADYDPVGFSYLNKTLKMNGRSMDDTNGFELGFAYVPVENTLATFRLWNMKQANNDRQTAGAIQLEYFWK